MDKYSYSTFFSLIVLLLGSCSQLSSPAQQTPLSTLPSLQEMGCSFVDSGQDLGAGRSWDVSPGDLDPFVANGSQGDVSSQVWLNDGSGLFSSQNLPLGLSDGGGMPNEVWWNETQ